MSNVHKEGQVATVPVEHCRDETTPATTLAIAAASRPDGPGIGLHMKADSAHTLGFCHCKNRCEHVKQHKYVPVCHIFTGSAPEVCIQSDGGVLLSGDK